MVRAVFHPSAIFVAVFVQGACSSQIQSHGLPTPALFPRSQAVLADVVHGVRCGDRGLLWLRTST